MHSIIPITALILSVLRTLLLYKDGFELQILNMQILKQRKFRITISIYTPKFSANPVAVKR